MSRLSPATLIVVVFALLLALAGAAFVRQTLQRPVAESTAAEDEKLFSVPVAGIDLLPGRRLVNNDIIVRQLTLDQLRKELQGGTLPKEFVSSSL